MERSYVPWFKPEKSYSPVALVTVERVAPVAVSVMVTVTPATAAPDWSVIVPVMSAFSCAYAVNSAQRAKMLRTNKCFQSLIMAVASC